MHLRHKARKALVLAVTAIGGLALALGTSAHAVAAPVVDTTIKGSITIEKLIQPDQVGLPSDGTQQSVTGTPVPNVTFDVRQVPGIDLGTNAGWNAAAAMTVTQALAAVATTGTTAVTDSNGIAVFANLPVGLYLIQETAVPTGVTPAAPFLVTVPMTDPTDSASWMYNIFVYPKDGFTAATKTVTDDSAVKLGDPVDFTITSTVPNVEVIDGFKVTDQLDSRLTYVGADVSLTNGPDLTVGVDYTVSCVDNLVTVEFSGTGLAKLATDPVGNALVVVIHTTANATGEISNQAMIYPDRPSFDITPGNPGGPIVTPPDSVITKWGNIVISKVDALAPTTVIPGVSFQVFASEQDALTQTNPITINGVDTWTTDGTGMAVIAGLRYSDWADGAAVAAGDPGYQSYWLVEVKAADGYALLATPVQVDVTSDSTTVPTATIKNSPINPNLLLPNTGGSLSATSWLVYLAGALLLAGAVMAVAYFRRRTTRSDA